MRQTEELKQAFLPNLSCYVVVIIVVVVSNVTVSTKICFDQIRTLYFKSIGLRCRFVIRLLQSVILRKSTTTSYLLISAYNTHRIG